MTTVKVWMSLTIDGQDSLPRFGKEMTMAAWMSGVEIPRRPPLCWGQAHAACVTEEQYINMMSALEAHAKP